MCVRIRVSVCRMYACEYVYVFVRVCVCIFLGL